MESLQGILALLLVVSLLTFVIVISYISLIVSSIKKRLKNSDPKQLEGYISKSIFEQGYQDTRAQNRFFKEGSWSGIDDYGIIHDLRKQLKLRSAARWCLIIFLVSYIAIMSLNVILYS